MTYREGFEQFIVDYRNECVNLGKAPRHMDGQEVMSFLSKSYVHLGNTYELVEATPFVLHLVAGQYEYASGSSSLVLIPTNILRIHRVRLTDADETDVTKVGLLNMPRGERAAGLPSYYTLLGNNASRKLIIDTVPALSYADNSDYGLTIYYKEKLVRYSGISVTGTSFSDLLFTDADDWGGSFKLPTEWDDLMVAGAVAYAVGVKSAIGDWLGIAEKMSKSRKEKTYVKRVVPYRLGVWSGQGRK